jgi:hypothetical protein
MAAELDGCGFCSSHLQPDHGHLLDMAGHRIVCVCKRCTRRGAEPKGGSVSPPQFKRIRSTCLYVADFRIPDGATISSPAGIFFLFFSSSWNRVRAFYPGPAGALESKLGLVTFNKLKSSNPILAELLLEPNTDVLALVVNRSRRPYEHYLVPIDECYRLVGLMRREWGAATDGRLLHESTNEFFRQLRAKSIEFHQFDYLEAVHPRPSSELSSR